jgi:hypothetical protein
LAGNSTSTSKSDLGNGFLLSLVQGSSVIFGSSLASIIAFNIQDIRSVQNIVARRHLTTKTDIFP